MSLATPLPPNENVRLEALRSLRLLDSPPDPLFDSLIKAAAEICQTPIALFSVVDSRRQWFKSRFGAEITEIPRNGSFCSYAILSNEILEVKDAALDPRFAGNSLVVEEPHVRFYAGAPVCLEDGLRIGTVCVIDVVPRQLEPHQAQALRTLSEVVAQLVRSQKSEFDAHSTLHRGLFEAAPVMLHSIANDGTILAANDLWLSRMGYSRDEVIGCKYTAFLTEESQAHALDVVLPRFYIEGTCRDEHLQFVRKSGEILEVLLSAVLEYDGKGKPLRSLAVLHDLTKQNELSRALERANADLEAIFAHVPARLGYWDSNLIGRMLNKQYAAVFGADAETFQGRHLEDVLDSLDPELTRATWDHVKEVLAGRRQDFEIQYQTTQGPQFEQIAYVPDLGHSGEVKGFYVLGFDITDRRRVEERLRASEQQYRLMFENMQSGFAHHRVILDEQGEPKDFLFLAVNPAFAEFTGIQAEEAVGRTIKELRPEITHQEMDWIGHFGKVALDGVTRRVEHYSEPNKKWYEFIAYQPAHQEFSVLIQDVTLRREMQSLLEAEHERLSVTLQSIADAVITTDTLGRIEYLNPLAERLTGWKLDQAKGASLLEVFKILDETTRAPAVNPVDRVLAEDRVVGMESHTVLLSREGVEYAIEDSAAPIRGSDGRILGVVLVFRDVTEKRRLSLAMSHQATHDPLTGIYNRAEFEVRLDRAFKEAKSEDVEHSLLYIDLDQFKLVNDASGHAVGDVLLQRVASIIESCIRSGDTFARMGGDEFAVILSRCSVKAALSVAQDIRTRVEEYRFVHNGRRFKVGASIGLVPVTSTWESTSELVQAADAACYAAKEAGRNQVYTYADPEERKKAQHTEINWAARLDEALENDRFVLFGQWITSAQNGGKKLGIEIFVRLQEADGSFVCASTFLPAAERLRLGGRLDRYVVGKVIAAMEADPLAWANLSLVSINLSAQSIGDQGLLSLLSSLQMEKSFVLSKLCFELSESAVVVSLDEAIDFLQRLRASGVRCALDDFGSGSSSFGYLKSLPVDLVKIDGALVRTIDADEISHLTVRCITEIARSLKMKTIAEWVESNDCLQKLQDLGVDYIQGTQSHTAEPLLRLIAPAMR